jgi:Flp pilus assembly protein TadD
MQRDLIRRALFSSLLACLFSGTEPLLPAQQIAATQKDGLAAASRMLLGKQYAQAEALLRKLLPDHENEAEAHVMLAYALFRDDKPAESLQEYTRAAQLRTPSAEDLKWVALDYVLLNDYKDAAKWISESLRMNPDDPEAWYSLGRIHYTQNYFRQAKDCFERTLQLSPHDVRAENNLGLTYEGLYQLDEAIHAYRTAIEWQQGSTHPNEQPYINLAIVLLNQNRLDEAMTLLQRAQTIAPEDTRMLTQLARIHYQLGKFGEAEIELRKVVAKSPDDAGAHFQLGRVLHKEGKTQEANQEFAAAARLNGTHSTPER